MKKYYCLLLMLFITGCSSTPKIVTHQYLLMPDPYLDGATTGTKSQSQDEIISIKPIRLASYLNQRGIILLTNKHEINVAHYHRWAEPLDENIHRFMLLTMSANTTRYVFQNSAGSSSQDTNLTLSIEFDQFNGTADGQAMVSGKWQLYDTDKNDVLVSDTFHYNQTMSESGYAELVNQFALILNQISLQIVSSISTLQP